MDAQVSNWKYKFNYKVQCPQGPLKKYICSEFNPDPKPWCIFSQYLVTIAWQTLHCLVLSYHFHLATEFKDWMDIFRVYSHNFKIVWTR